MDYLGLAAASVLLRNEREIYENYTASLKQESKGLYRTLFSIYVKDMSYAVNKLTSPAKNSKKAHH